MTSRLSRNPLHLALAIVVFAAGLGLAVDAPAQEIVYIGGGPVVYQPPLVYPAPIQYQRIYQGTSWHWTPTLGWYTRDHYIDVPQFSPSVYVYPQVPSVTLLPIISRY